MFLGGFALDCVLDITCGINYTAQLFSFSSDVTSFELQAVVQLGFYALFSPKTGGFPSFFLPPLSKLPSDPSSVGSIFH